MEMLNSLDTNTTLIPILENIDGDIVSSIKSCLASEQNLIVTGSTTHKPILIYILAILCSALIGLSGLLPLIFTFEYSFIAKELVDISEEQENQFSSCQSTNANAKDVSNNILVKNGTIKKQSKSSHEVPSSTKHNLPKLICTKQRLKYMLSFAVGSLLGDVFLHLLPTMYSELYNNAKNAQKPKEFLQLGHITIGIWIISGILVFILIEWLYSSKKPNDDLMSKKYCVDQTEKSTSFATNVKTDNPVITTTTSYNNNRLATIGYLNILANCIDNFFNGVGVGMAFLASTKLGITTTFSILVHEVPNGMGDYAILVKSGFTQYHTVITQLLIAMLGLLGTCITFLFGTFDSSYGVGNLEHYASWIIPFNCGGFINISLMNVVPDLMNSEDVKDYFKTLGLITLGIFSIFLVTRM